MPERSPRMGIGGLPEDRTIWPLAPSFLEGEQAERYRRGMSPSASLEDRVFYLSCRFDGHQMLLQRNQRDIFDLMDRNRKNVKRAWRARRIPTGDGSIQ